MPKQAYTIICTGCHQLITDPKITAVCPDCRSALSVEYEYDHLKDSLNLYLLQNAPPKTIKYLDFYPLTDRENMISLNDGGTPLIHAKNFGRKYHMQNVYIKNEGLNPTGAFKDRGSFIEINKARELGYESVVVASTGNMAASIAAYSAQAKMPCYVFVPVNTPRGKLAQALSYGAHIIQVKGTYNDAADLAEKTAAEYGFYLAGDYAYRLEGQKSIAYEIAEQLFFQAPDWVIIPIGMGTNISAIWRGFKEYKTFGLIDALPKIVGVQAENCQPVVLAFNNNSEIVPVPKPATVSSAIAVGNPLDAGKALSALRESSGVAIGVSDDATLTAQQDLAHREALYIEPSAATTIAALLQLRAKNIITETNKVICVATGIGLKDPATTLKILAEPPVIQPSMKEVERVLRGGILKLRSSGLSDQNKILFKTLPEPDELKKIIQKEFDANMQDLDMTVLIAELDQFIRKGKKIIKADVQVILETLIQQQSRTKYMEVRDFTITDTMKDPAQATITIALAGKTYSDSATGDGPVDAAINALRKPLTGNGHIYFELVDFNVEVASSGTDASVIVTMILKDDKNNEVVVRESSPDIIAASIMCFERGYNELCEKNDK